MTSEKPMHSDSATIELDQNTSVILAIVAGHDGVTADEWVLQSIIARADEIGVGRLLDTQTRLVGGKP
ncbi:MAG: hypothetical protein AAFR27_10575 [Pseudomonadota bacterium]